MHASSWNRRPLLLHRARDIGTHTITTDSSTADPLANNTGANNPGTVSSTFDNCTVRVHDMHIQSRNRVLRGCVYKWKSMHTAAWHHGPLLLHRAGDPGADTPTNV